MIKLLVRSLVSAVLLLSLTGRADIVQDLYSAEVPVADQTPAALASASRDALAEVLVKVSGTAGILRNPEIAKALGGARNQVQQYAYRRGEEPGELYARLEFDGNYVRQLVTAAGEPLWTANRPRVLVWLVLEDSEGRRFVEGESSPELLEVLLAEFGRRGLPVQQPLYDLADAAAITTDQAWRLDAGALRSASERYGTQDILAGRLAALSSGSWSGEWSYFYGGDRSNRASTGASPEAFAREGASMVAESMSARYAVASAGGSGAGVGMMVMGVERYADYAGIVAWLEGLELVDHANIERIQGDRILLRLHAAADAAQLAPIIELNPRFQPLSASAAGFDTGMEAATGTGIGSGTATGAGTVPGTGPEMGAGAGISAGSEMGAGTDMGARSRIETGTDLIYQWQS